MGYFWLIWATAEMLPYPESQQVAVTVCLPYLHLTNKALSFEYLMHVGDSGSPVRTPICRELGGLPMYVPQAVYCPQLWDSLGEGV